MWKLLAGLTLLIIYLFIQALVTQPPQPAFPVKPPATRTVFPVDLSLPDLAGHVIHLSDLTNKVVLVNFWATWCYPCRAEMPSLNHLYAAYRSHEFTVLAIASDTAGEATVQPFVSHYDLKFPVLLDPSDHTGQRLQLPGIPMTYVLDKHGRVATVAVGAKQWDSPSARQLIRTLLAEP